MSNLETLQTIYHDITSVQNPNQSREVMQSGLAILVTIIMDHEKRIAELEKFNKETFE
jgi:hypothetical protein